MITGAASEVPPIRYSLYFCDPFGNVWVWPIRKPVFGSATAAMSGSTRCLTLPPLARASESGTTPRW